MTTLHTQTLLLLQLQPFNGLFSRTTWVSRYQQGKTNLDFTEARDSEWQWHQLGHMQVCTSLQTDNHTSTPPPSCLQAGCPSCRPTNSVKALKAVQTHRHTDVKILPPTFSRKQSCSACRWNGGGGCCSWCPDIAPPTHASPPVAVSEKEFTTEAPAAVAPRCAVTQR